MKEELEHAIGQRRARGSQASLLDRKGERGGRGAGGEEGYGQTWELGRCQIGVEC